MQNEQLEELQEIIGYKFKETALLEKAFTHSSADSSVGKNYERLEFLGDALINIIIADYCFNQSPDCSEGDLTLMKSNIVSGVSLSRISKEIGVCKFIFFGKGMDKQKVPDSICCDVLESLCAAVFLDSDMQNTKELVLRILKDEIEKAVPMTRDAKSRLQEIIQKQSNAIPIYQIVHVSGKEHEKIFSSTVNICGIEFGPCEGKTKKKAEQRAALLALKVLTD